MSTGFTLNALFDTRDNSINPYRGFYANGTYRNNLEFLGSNRDWQSVIIDIRKYFRFPRESRNILACWNYDRLSSMANPPTSTFRPRIGILIRAPAADISRAGSGAMKFDFESEYRFPLLANGFLGAVVFVNGESFSGLDSHRLQSVQPGWGAGLRVKLNKTSRTNVDIDYGFGEQGSNGLFVNIGELF